MSKSIPHAPTVVIDDIYPSLEGGRYPIKRVVNEPLTVFADIFKDGHDVITAMLKWRKAGARSAASCLRANAWPRCSNGSAEPKPHVYAPLSLAGA